jgi:myo-inositol-1-phosphate synthase
VEFVAAFDVHAAKVGRDLAEAIYTAPNNTYRFADVPPTGVTVQAGPVFDGVGRYTRAVVPVSAAGTADVAAVLREARADVLINYLPVGSEAATRWYVEQALAAGVGVVNCIPVFIARERPWQRRFEAAGVPIVGDDIKSQVGATIVHRVLARLFEERGVVLERTSQLNVGGNTDFMNMLERDRLESKKISKTNAVTSQLTEALPPENVYIGPSDYIPWLTDRKWAHIRLEGRSFGDVPLNLELKLEVWDSPNSAGVVIDALRCVKLARDRGIAGVLEGPSAYFMKSPPVQHDDGTARRLVEAFIAEHAVARVGSRG